MSGNTIGKIFTVTTFGESHGPALGCIIDGCPPGLEICEADLQPDIDRLVARYEELLPASLPLKEGKVLGHVREILTTLASERPDVRSYLLTGNTAGGARAKLVYYGLWELISRGAFSVDATERAGIARRALELARADGPVGAEEAIVIGDTPHDIHCANAIGARTLAVATGGYALDELMAHQPWHGCQELPEPREFLALIGTHS